MAQRPGRVGGVEHVGTDPLGQRRARRLSKRSSCSAGEGVVGLVGHGQVGEQALQVQVRSGRHLAGQFDERARAGPHAVHPGVDLQMARATGAGAPPAAVGRLGHDAAPSSAARPSSV